MSELEILKLKEIIEEQYDEITHHENMEIKYENALKKVLDEIRYKTRDQIGDIIKEALEDDQINNPSHTTK